MDAVIYDSQFTATPGMNTFRAGHTLWFVMAKNSV